MVLTMPEPSPKTQLAFSLLKLFPPLLRTSALEDSEFRRATGLNLQANIRLNHSGLTFDRATLYAAVKDALSAAGGLNTVESADGARWQISKGEDGILVLSTDTTTVPLPDFECLSQDSLVRLNWFERQSNQFD